MRSSSISGEGPIGLLRQFDELIKAWFRMRNRCWNPEYYRGGSASLILVIVGLADIGRLIVIGGLKSLKQGW